MRIVESIISASTFTIPLQNSVYQNLNQNCNTLHSEHLIYESCMEGGVNMQSNLKLTRFKPIKTVGPDMFGLRLDMSGLGWICSVLGQICLVKLDHALRKSRSGSKMMSLSSDMLTACKLNTIELREIKVTTRSNLNTRNHT
jgi:hypothetical protein